MKDTPKTYELNQVMINPRDGGHQLFHFDEFSTLAEAKKAAKTLPRWCIIEKRIVAVSETRK